MFRPNQNCVIKKASGKTDVYGMPIIGASVNERCAVVKLNIRNEKSAVRADTSASRGNAREFQDDAEILLTKTSIAEIDDVIVVGGQSFLISSKFPRYDVRGELDHIQISCTYWSTS